MTHGRERPRNDGSEAVLDLRYKMIMALNAADIGSPLCEQIAGVCAEIAEQHCTQLHVTRRADVIDVIQVTTGAPARL